MLRYHPPWITPTVHLIWEVTIWFELEQGLNNFEYCSTVLLKNMKNIETYVSFMAFLRVLTMNVANFYISLYFCSLRKATRSKTHRNQVRFGLGFQSSSTKVGLPQGKHGKTLTFTATCPISCRRPRYKWSFSISLPHWNISNSGVPCNSRDSSRTLCRPLWMTRTFFIRWCWAGRAEELTDLQETEGEEGEEAEETVETEAPWILQNAGLPQNGGWARQLNVLNLSWTSEIQLQRSETRAVVSLRGSSIEWLGDFSGLRGTWRYLSLIKAQESYRKLTSTFNIVRLPPVLFSRDWISKTSEDGHLKAVKSLVKCSSVPKIRSRWLGHQKSNRPYNISYYIFNHWRFGVFPCLLVCLLACSRI